MAKKIFSIFTLIFSLGVFSVQSQHDDHHHARNEIGISGGALYGIDDKEWGGGFHIHYFHTLGVHSRWAVGGFAEQAWFDKTHYSVGAGVKWEILSRLQLGLFPGVTFAKEHDHDEHIGGRLSNDLGEHDDKIKARFSIHAELVYDLFHYNGLHFGPAFDYSWSRDDSHIMLGAHVAYGF